jgi:hypothetical protein
MKLITLPSNVIRSKTTYQLPSSRRVSVLFKITRLLNLCDTAVDDIEEVQYTKKLFDYIHKNMRFIESSYFLKSHLLVHFYNLTKQVAEDMMDLIDSLLVERNCTLEERHILLDGLESISSVYYTWFPENDECEHDYLNSYLED